MLRCAPAHPPSTRHLPTPPATGTPAHAHEEHEAPSTEARASRPLALRGVAGRRGGARRDKKRKAEPEAKAAYSPTPHPTGNLRTRTKSTRHWRNHTRILAHTHPSASPHLPASLRGSGSEDGAVRAQGEGTARHIGSICASIKQAEAKNRRREGKVRSRPHAPARCTPCRPFVALDAESRIRKSKRACALRT